jgi:hypothetical protein
VLSDREVEVVEVLCDDADDPNAPTMIEFWKNRYGAVAEIMEGADGTIAVVRPKAS